MGLYILTTAKDNSQSWFIHIKNLCAKYQLPHPLTLLQEPLSKDSFKALSKAKVVDHWEQLLRSEAKSLSSLSYFKPEFMSLVEPHPLWKTCQGNPFEVSKAIVEARMLSGRYRCEKLTKHFKKNCDGLCGICEEKSEGSVEHLLVQCPTLEDCRQKQLLFMERTDISHTCKAIIQHYLKKPSSELVQFLLDCSVIPSIIEVSQDSEMILSELFQFTRTWCFNMHMSRLKLLGLWKKSFYT